MGFAHFHVTRMSAAHNHAKRAPNPACLTGGLYKYPSLGLVVDASKPVPIVWDPTCFKPSNVNVDIYLFAPSDAQSLIHMWKDVPNTSGQLNTYIEPKWYQSASTKNLQLAIVEANTPVSMTTLPAGPVFIAKYTPGSGDPAIADTSKPDAGITDVGAITSTHGLSPGKKAAAVIMTLLVFIALGVTFWIRRSRRKGQQKRKRWSEAVDRRMSTISTDWKSVTPSGAKEAIRHSMAISNRTSNYAFANARPQSTASEMGQGARGGSGLFLHHNQTSESLPQMSQLRPGLRTSAFSSSERTSRVMFANDPRPKSRYNEKSIYGDNLPPVPLVSPDQAHGPLTLTADDIRARMQGIEKSRSSVDEVMPALTLMRTGGVGSDPTGDDYLLWEAPDTPQAPSPAQVYERSPVGMMPMQAMPANVMSPDDLLKAYAARQQSLSSSSLSSPSSSVAEGLTSPPRVAGTASYNGNGVRTLYNPTSPLSMSVMGGVGLRGKNRQSVIQCNQEDAEIGTAT